MERDELRAEAESEAVGNIALDELSGKDGDITLDDLRKLPGTENMSDDELQQAWDATAKAGDTPAGETPSTHEQGAVATAIAAATGGEAVQTARGWKIYDDAGNEVADLSKMSASDLLKLKIGYKANGSEHRKSFDELVRVASFGHHNEQKIAGITVERNRAFAELRQLRQTAERLGTNEKALKYAFTQFHLGNEKPLKTLLDAFKQDLNKPEFELESQQGQVDSDLEAAGMRYFYENIVPRADAISAKYGADANEVRNAIKTLIEREPAETLTQEKINSIIENEIPYHLEQAGYTMRGAAPVAPVPAVSAPITPGNDDLASVRRELAELRAKLANSETERLRQRKLPPGGNGATASASTDDITTIPAEATKDRNAFRNFLKS